MTPAIGLFLGNFSSFNVERTVRNFGLMLNDAFNLDLITTTPNSFADEVLEPYRVYGGNHPTTRRGELAALWFYLNTKTPDMLTQIGSVPIYGNLISLLRDAETRFVCRWARPLHAAARLGRREAHGRGAVTCGSIPCGSIPCGAVLCVRGGTVRSDLLTPEASFSAQALSPSVAACRRIRPTIQQDGKDNKS